MHIAASLMSMEARQRCVTVHLSIASHCHVFVLQPALPTQRLHPRLGQSNRQLSTAQPSTLQHGPEQRSFSSSSSDSDSEPNPDCDSLDVASDATNGHSSGGDSKHPSGAKDVDGGGQMEQDQEILHRATQRASFITLAAPWTHARFSYCWHTCFHLSLCFDLGNLCTPTFLMFCHFIFCCNFCAP